MGKKVRLCAIVCIQSYGGVDANGTPQSVPFDSFQRGVDEFHFVAHGFIRFGRNFDE